MELNHYLLSVYERSHLRAQEIIVSLNGDATEVLKAFVQKDNVRLRENDWLRKDPVWAKCAPSNGPYIERKLLLQYMPAKFI